MKRCPPCGKYMKEWTAWTSCSAGQSTMRRTKSFDIAKQQAEFMGMDCANVMDIVQDLRCPSKKISVNSHRL